MPDITAATIQSLIAKAFVLEALTDKPGCTTRYEDLPGKPLQDFVIAGINSSHSFAEFAAARLEDPSTPIFAYNLAALKASNVHKSPKFVNFGLLEILFPTVAARLLTSDQAKVIDLIPLLIQQTTNQDVRCLLATRQLAWGTSRTDYKLDFDATAYETLASVADFYAKLRQDYAIQTSNHQWVKQFDDGLPIMRRFLEGYTADGEIMHSTKSIFLEQKDANPDTAVGIIADMCAAAIFLWLSFNDSPA